MLATIKPVLPIFVLVALLLTFFVLFPGTATPVAAQAPVSNAVTVPVYGPVAVLTGTVTTASPNVDTYGRDVSDAAMFESVDIFLTSAMTGNAWITATAQVSADGVNWANATQDYWTGSAIATSTKARSLSAAGTTYMNVPLSGAFWRVSIATTGVATNTVKATLHKED